MRIKQLYSLYIPGWLLRLTLPISLRTERSRFSTHLLILRGCLLMHPE